MGLSTRSGPRIRFTDSWASVHLDTLRAVAALLVLLEHWRNLFFADYPQLSPLSRRWLFVPYALSTAGHQAVVLFFVLSGFFIGGTVLRSIEGSRWQWRDYLLRRLVRLWVVLVPTLLLSLFWDGLGIRLGHSPALYGGRVANHMVPDVTRMLAPHLFFGNLFFLQTILCPTFGSAPLWSLANEFWYYILFPLACVALWRRTGWLLRVASAILFVAIAWFVHHGILPAFPIWLLGAALVKIPAPTFTQSAGRYIRIGATLVYFPILLVLGRVVVPFSDFFLAILTCILLWLLLSDSEAFARGSRTVIASREFARFSYTLYLAHMPLLLFAASILIGDSRWYPTPGHLFAGLVMLLAALAYSYGLAFLTEFRTDKLRNWLEKLLRMQSSPPILPSNPLSDTGAPSAPG